MDAFYLTLFTKAGQMFAILAPVAFVFIVTGLWTTVNSSGRSASVYLKAIAKAAVLVLVLSQFIGWTGLFEEQVESLVYGTLNANPGSVYDRYKALATTSDSGDGGFWSSLFRLSYKEAFKAVIAAILWVTQFFAKIIVYLAYVVYHLTLAYLIATAPFFIGCLAVRTAAHTGMAFIYGVVGVLLWPLGWGFASLVTDALLTVLAGNDFGVAEGFGHLFVAAAAGLWVIFSTIAAPLLLQRIIRTGAGMGAALLSGGLNAAKSGAQAGTTAGATLAASGVGVPFALLGAAGAGAVAAGTSSLSGASRSDSAMVLGNIVRMGSCMFGGSSGEGGQSAQPAPAYRADDPARDQETAALIPQHKPGDTHAS